MFSHKITDSVEPEEFDEALRNEAFEHPKFQEGTQAILLRTGRPRVTHFTILWPYGGTGYKAIPISTGSP